MSMISSSLKKRLILLVSGLFLFCFTAFAVWFRSELAWHKSGPWVARGYKVSFQWNNGIKSVHVLDTETRKPESDPTLRRIVLRQSENVVRDIINRTALNRGDGEFRLALHGSSEPYLVSWSDADIPELDQLMEAAADWDLETVRRIISGGMSVDARALDSRDTALILAASDPRKGLSPARLSRFAHPPDKDTFQYLLAAGANPNVTGYLGATALMRANDALIVKALLHRGVAVNAKADNGWSALIYAIEHEDMEKLQILINAHADVNSRDKKGWTPLMYTANEGDLEATKLLLASGANPRIANSEGESALSIVRRKRNPTPADKKLLDLLSANPRNPSTR